MGRGRDGGGSGVSGVIICLLVVLILFVALVAAAGLVLGALAYMKVEDMSDDGTSSLLVGLTGDDRIIDSSSGSSISTHDIGEIWRFAIGHYNNRVEYLDEAAGLIKGYNVDIIHAVCRTAGKNCQIVQDSYDHCWESPHGYDARGGIGLMGGYYDACTGWFVTKDRLRVYDFSDSFHQARPSVFLVKAGNPNNFQYDDLSGKKVGFLESWAADEHCVNNLDIDGIPLNSVTQASYYLTQTELEAAVTSDEVDAAFVAIDLSIVQNLEQQGPDIEGCLVDGSALMVRKGSALPLWWNRAFSTLMSTREYEEICADVDTVHGSIPGPPADELCI